MALIRTSPPIPPDGTLKVDFALVVTDDAVHVMSPTGLGGTNASSGHASEAETAFIGGTTTERDPLQDKGSR